MSGYILLQQRSAIQIITDTLGVFDGRVSGFGTKAFVLPTMPAVVAGVGVLGFVAAVARDLEFQAATFDDLLAYAPQMVGKCDAIFAQASGGRYVSSRYALQLAGWSPLRGRLAAFHLHRGFRGAMGELQESGRVMSMPGVVGWPCPHPDDFSPERDGVALIEAMRALPEMAGRIGGAAVLTTLTRSEVKQRVLHRWPDQIGQPVAEEIAA